MKNTFMLRYFSNFSTIVKDTSFFIRSVGGNLAIVVDFDRLLKLKKNNIFQIQGDCLLYISREKIDLDEAIVTNLYQL